ncbi:S4 domain-containing protein, partial [Escherichia coli]
MSEKLQKVLARAGHGSRREIESIIEAGRVSVDGKIAKLGDRVEVTPGLKIRIDGHLISVRESAEQICRVLAYYKPEGELCTRNDPEGRPTVFDGTVAKLAMRQPFVLFKGLTFQKLCLPGAFRPGDHHNKMLRPG